MMDNRYTRYELFSKLRKLNIGAVGIITKDYRKGHFKEEAEARAGTYPWGTAFFEAMGRLVDHKRTTRGITHIEQVYKGGDDVAIKL